MGDEVLIVYGQGEGSFATITHDHGSSNPYRLKGATRGSSNYSEAQVLLARGAVVEKCK